MSNLWPTATATSASRHAVDFSSPRPTSPKPRNFARAGAGEPPIGLVARPASRSFEGRLRRQRTAGASLGFANLAPRRDFGAPTAVAADPMHLVSSDNRADVPLPCFAREQGRRDRALLRAVGRALSPAGRRDAGALLAPQSASEPMSGRLPCSPRKGGREASFPAHGQSGEEAHLPRFAGIQGGGPTPANFTPFDDVEMPENGDRQGASVRGQQTSRGINAGPGTHPLTAPSRVLAVEQEQGRQTDRRRHPRPDDAARVCVVGPKAQRQQPV